MAIPTKFLNLEVYITLPIFGDRLIMLKGNMIL